MFRTFTRCAATLAVLASHCANGAELIFLDPICKPDAPRSPKFAPGNPAPSTRKMADLLKKLGDAADPVVTPYFSDRAIPILTNAVATATDLPRKSKLMFTLGIQHMLAGRPDFALNTFADFEASLKATGSNLPDNMRHELRMNKAVAYLRLGEQENCIANGTADSCLFPLRPKAQHYLPRGSRGAIELLQEQLAEKPNDLAARWLLNIAYMTLGEYPTKVPAPFVIDPKYFASEYDLPRFPDVSANLGLNIDDTAGGAIVDDFDNDGFLDVVVSSWDLREQLRYFKNNGDGTFTERTSEAALIGITGGLNLQQTDYNNDGHLDFFVLRGAWLGKGGRIPNSLVRNNGDGTFTDVTEEAGLLTFHPTQTCEWLDYDGDGWLDLFIGNETTDRNDPDFCELFHNNRDGTFTECARQSGIGVAAFVKGVAAGDYNNDGRPDLYISRQDGQSLLFRNDGPRTNGAPGAWKFTEISRTAGADRQRLSFPAWFFDYDNDGWEDIFSSGYRLPNGVADVAADYLGVRSQATLPKLFHNNGNGTFTDVTESAHLNRVCHTMGCNYGDLDNDGWLDFYSATGDPELSTIIPNRMFRNAGGKYFQDVTAATGTGHLQKGHAIAFADIDNDGDQDIYAVNGGAYFGDNAKNSLYLNPGSTNAWLNLKLIGVKANRAAIGARVKVTAKTPNGLREIHRTVTHGASFGANPLRLEIGLGDATEITTVEIRWPGSNLRETIRGFEVGRAYDIREGAGTAVVRNFKRVPLPLVKDVAKAQR